jgi:hypothetical protein
MIKRRATVGVALAAVLLTAGCSASTGPQLPSNMPASVHVIPGTVVDSSVNGAQWQVWIKSPEIVAGYKKARALLLKAGYYTTYDNLYSTSGEGQFCTARYCVDVNAYDDPKRGKTVGYYVYRNSALGVAKN